jgi:hypothetical protein
VPFTLGRAVLYFVLWSLVAFMLHRTSLEQDRTGDPDLPRLLGRRSRFGLVFVILALSFASFDWAMSLDAHWFSTIYGMLFLAAYGLTGIAFAIVVLWLLAERPPTSEVTTPATFSDLGNLLLAFVMLWTYMNLSQYLIIWSGNLPEEISWYTHRLQTGWRFIGLILVLFHFAVPFCLLLSRVVKREGEMLVKVAIGILLVRLVDLFWLVAPEFHVTGVVVSWMDIVLPLTLGAIWLATFVWQLRGRAILPVHDPQFDEALGKIIERGGSPRTAH